MITQHDKLLIAVLQGRTEQFGPNIIPPELRADPVAMDFASDLSDEDVMYEVKALLMKLGNNLPVLRRLMSGSNKWSETFTTNVNSVLARIDRLEKSKEEAANKKQLSVQKSGRK